MSKMKQATKEMVSKGIKRRLAENTNFDVSVFHKNEAALTAAVTDTLLSAIKNGYEKIRVNDQIHLRVKKVKGGVVSSFVKGTGLNGSAPSREVRKLPDRYVVSFVTTRPLEVALKDRISARQYKNDTQITTSEAPTNE